ncbi:MAG TPA: hypothetical protein VGL42_04505 [Opitutaceae bacterium]|jgi:hypothetical protein
MSYSLRPGFFNPLVSGLILMVGLTGAVGIGAVWAQHQLSLLANDNRVVEAKIANVERQSDELDSEIAQEQDTRVLLARAAQWHLGLAEPSADHVQHITIDPLRHLSRKEGGEGILLPTAPSSGIGLALGGR